MYIFLLFLLIISCCCDPIIPTITTTFKGAILHTLWCGPTSSPTFLVLTSQGEVFRSIDFGDKFDVIHQPFGVKNPNPRPIAVKSIEKSPMDNSLVFFLGATNELWVSEDCGEDLMEILTAGTIIDVKPHPLERTWVLVSTLGSNCGVDSSESPARCKNLYFSKRLGQNLKEIRDQVVDFSWGVEDISYLENVPITRIYVCSYGGGLGLSNAGLRRGKWSKSIDLYSSDNFFKNQTKVLAGGNRFLLKEKRIFVVKAINDATQEVGLFIGKAHRRNIELKAIELPVKHLGQYSYSILDITRESIIIQIKHQGAQIQLPLGNIYVINRKTLVSSLSLLNNLINNNGVPQFEKIEGIPGVYVANALEHDKAELLEKEIEKNQGTTDTNTEASAIKLLEKYIKTYITYDYGGRWHSIDLRGTCTLECQLNLNIRTFSDKGPVYSKSNALGLILGTGNIGSYLTHRNISTFYSLDGGNEWMFLGEGSHTYDFGDHGGLIVIGSTDSETDRIRYSWTSWKTWETVILPGNLSIFNIMTEEDNRGLHFMILGQSSNLQENLIISLDFNALNKRPCLKDSDYEIWSPFNAQHCVLGIKTLFLKRKSGADCVNGLEFERPMSTEICECSDEDWECDVGFFRSSGVCERQGFSNETEEIQAQMVNCVDFIVVRSGYRLIPGSKCIGGIQYKTKRINCPVNNNNNDKEGISEWWLLLVILFLVVLAIFKRKNIKLVDKIAGEEKFPNDNQENNTIFNEESL